MPTIRDILLSTILLFSLVSGYTQQLYFKNISNTIQIPSPECYNIFQDSKGYIWFGTESGLCKFDGTRLQIFDKKNGLPEASVYSIAEDNKQVLWFATAKNRILKYENDSLTEIKLGKVFDDFIKTNYIIPDKIIITTEREAYLNSNFGTYKIDLKTGIRSLIEEYPIQANFIFEKKGNSLVRITPIKKNIPNGKYIKTVIIDGRDTTIVQFEKDKKASYNWRSVSCSLKGTHYISIDANMIKIGPDKKASVHNFPSRIFSMFIDKDEGLWVGTYKYGLFYYPDINKIENPIRSLTDCSITGIILDKEDNVWCTSLEKGVLFCSNKNIIDYRNVEGLDQSIDLLKNEAGRLFISSGISQLFEIGENVIKHDLKIKYHTTITDIIKDDGGWLISGSSMAGKIDGNFKGISYYIKDSTGANIMLYEMEKVKNTLYGLSYQNIVRCVGQKVYYTKVPFKSPSKYFIHSYDEVFYVGCSSGLYLVNFANNAYVPIMEGASVSKVMKSRTGYMWFTTKGGGVFVIKDNIAYNISSLLKIPTDYYYDIAEDKYNNIWLASNIGLVKLELNGSRNKFVVFDGHNGLPSKIINKVATNDKHVFFSSSEGLFSLPVNKGINNKDKPNIYIHSVYINGNLFDKNEKNIILPYNKNSLRIGFDAITYKNLGQRELSYRLKGREKTFQKNVGSEIVLDNLPPGKYELEVYAINNENVLSPKPAILKFQIKKPFWQTWVFIISCILIGIFIIFLIVKKATSNIKRKEEEKTHINKLMAEYQLSAIQAQMNPHFIFNAINSIQSYILQKNEQQAYDYLAKFSKLIRMVLNNSEEKILPLHQELQTLGLYIQLEKLRFDNKFEYILDISKEVNTHDVLVPAMLIQPYVENAIWHGLMNLDNRPAMLKISVSIVNDNLFISIEDNGIGREIAAQFKKNTDHKSIGMKLNQKRLTMINQLKDFEDAKVQVIDIKDESGTACGTRVEIYIPIN